jgi:hypothetical protein
MTGPEHYRRAGQLIEGITSMNEFGIQIAKNPEFIAAAQTHAILALTAATALNSDSREWLNVAGTKISG